MTQLHRIAPGASAVSSSSFLPGPSCELHLLRQVGPPMTHADSTVARLPDGPSSSASPTVATRSASTPRSSRTVCLICEYASTLVRRSSFHQADRYKRVPRSIAKIGVPLTLIVLHGHDETGPWTLPEWWVEHPQSYGPDGRGAYGSLGTRDE